MKRALFIAILATLYIYSAQAQKNSKPIISSVNFTTPNNLWEAVGHGILNFQADVMYIYGKLYVTPLMPDSANHKLPTLTDAYLYPLFNQFKKNNGEIIPGYTDDIFLILNFTTQPIQAYKQLASDMRPFADMLTYLAEGKKHQGKLRILIKDKVQLEKINSIKASFLGLAGTPDDLDKNIDPEVMPLIEVDFNKLTDWKGTGNIPFVDFSKIKDLVAKAHAQKKKISFINCPSHKTVADLILSSKADFINTPEAFRMAEYFSAMK